MRLVGVVIASGVVWCISWLALYSKYQVVSPKAQANQERMIEELDALRPGDLIVVYPNDNVAMFQHRSGSMMQLTFGDGEQFENRVTELVARATRRIVKSDDAEWCELIRRYHRIPTPTPTP